MHEPHSTPSGAPSRPAAPIHIPPPTLEAHQLLPLAPDVTTDGTVDALGYAGAARDWTWPGWAGTARIVTFSDWLYVTLPKIDPVTNILPLCLLTDCERESVT